MILIINTNDNENDYRLRIYLLLQVIKVQYLKKYELNKLKQNEFSSLTNKR